MSMYFGCTQKSAQLQKGIVPPDRNLYEMGENYLQRGLYDRSRLAFQTFLNTYPDSDLASEAYFAMGDTYYEQGGVANYLQAENQYKNFITFYRGDPRTADAQMKIISLNHMQMNTPDRDPQYANNVLREIKNFELWFPGHDYTPLLQPMKINVEDNLARGDLGVADYYFKSGNLLGAMQRLEYIVENYKNFEEMDTVQMRIADLYYQVSQMTDDEVRSVMAAATAAEWYSKVAEGYPFSRHYDTAIKRLTEIGFEIPRVNEALAADNLAKIKPSEGFNPIKPLVDFAKALGIIQPTDQYEAVRKTIEEERAATAKAERDKLADDIQIISIISRSGDGAPTDETSEPSGDSEGAGESQDSTPDSDSGASPNIGAGQQSKSSRYQRKP